jgi:hypothetical protein
MACWTITHLDHSLRFFFILYILFSHSTPHLYDLSQLAITAGSHEEKKNRKTSVLWKMRKAVPKLALKKSTPNKKVRGSEVKDAADGPPERC